MNKRTAGNMKIREDHKLEILNFIRKSGPVSRTRIYEKTNISKPTVTRVIEALAKDSLVKETGTGKSASSGRRPVDVELNADALYCIGINISRNTIYASVVDLAMNVRHSSIFAIKGINSAEAFNSAVAGSIRVLLDKSGIEAGKFIGIGIGVPGMVDFERGIILDFAITHHIMDIRLKEYLEKAFGLRVYIDNNANTRALGEYWYGYGTGLRNIIFVICSEGIGSGIISDGNILRGKSNITGELGHMTVNIDGRKCSCGRYGCIEAYCSTEAIENIMKEALKRGRGSSLLELAGGDIESINYTMICKCTDAGDTLCIEKLEEAACILSTGIINLIGIVNPEMIVLSGNLFDVCDLFYNLVTRMTRERLVNSAAQDVIFKKRNVKDSLYEIGAATMVFKDFFKD